MHAILDFLKNLHDSGHLQQMVRTGGVPLIALIVFAETGLLVGFSCRATRCCSWPESPPQR